MQALRSLHDPGTQELLDRALVLRFPAPASFTGLTALLSPSPCHSLQPF